MISADGRFILFASTANNLASCSNNIPVSVGPPAYWNTYLHDRESNSTQIISVNLPGAGGGNGDSFPRGISESGQLVLFESGADDLVSNDTNGTTDIFIRDLNAAVDAARRKAAAQESAKKKAEARALREEAAAAEGADVEPAADAEPAADVGPANVEPADAAAPNAQGEDKASD